MPLAGGGSRAGPAQCSPARRLDASSCDVSSLSSGEEDERLRQYRTAHHATLHPPTQQVLSNLVRGRTSFCAMCDLFLAAAVHTATIIFFYSIMLDRIVYLPDWTICPKGLVYYTYRLQYLYPG